MRIVRPLTLSIALMALSPLGAMAQSQDTQASPAARRLDRICSDQGGNREARISEMMTQRLSLNDQQKNLLKDLGDARAKGRSDTKAALCNTRPPLVTFKDREAFWETLLTARLAAMKTVRPKADAFYDSLDQTQKTAFEGMIDKWIERRMDRQHESMRGSNDSSGGRRDYDRGEGGDRQGYRDRGMYRDDDRSRGGRYDDERYGRRDRDYDDERGDRSWRRWRDDHSYDRDREYYGRDERPRYGDSYRPRDRSDDGDEE